MLEKPCLSRLRVPARCGTSLGVPAYRRATPFSSLPPLRSGQSPKNGVARRYAWGTGYAPTTHRPAGAGLIADDFAVAHLVSDLRVGSPAHFADPSTRVRGRNVPPANGFSLSLKFVSPLRSHKLENTEIPGYPRSAGTCVPRCFASAPMNTRAVAGCCRTLTGVTHPNTKSCADAGTCVPRR